MNDDLLSLQFQYTPIIYMPNLRNNLKSRKNKRLQPIQQNPQQNAKAKLLQFSQIDTLAQQNMSAAYQNFISEHQQIQPSNSKNTCKFQISQRKKILQNFWQSDSFNEKLQHQTSYNRKFASSDKIIDQSQRYFRIIKKSCLSPSNYLLLGSSRTQTQSQSLPKKNKNIQSERNNSFTSQTNNFKPTSLFHKKRNMRLRRMYHQNQKVLIIEQNKFNDKSMDLSKGAKIRYNIDDNQAYKIQKAPKIYNQFTKKVTNKKQTSHSKFILQK